MVILGERAKEPGDDVFWYSMRSVLEPQNHPKSTKSQGRHLLGIQKPRVFWGSESPRDSQKQILLKWDSWIYFETHPPVNKVDIFFCKIRLELHLDKCCFFSSHKHGSGISHVFFKIRTLHPEMLCFLFQPAYVRLQPIASMYGIFTYIYLCLP